MTEDLHAWLLKARESYAPDGIVGMTPAAECRAFDAGWDAAILAASSGPEAVDDEAMVGRIRLLEAHLTEAIERIEKGDLDDRMCCDGHMCGCRGSSKADEFLHSARAALAATRRLDSDGGE